MQMPQPAHRSSNAAQGNSGDERRQLGQNWREIPQSYRQNCRRQQHASQRHHQGIHWNTCDGCEMKIVGNWDGKPDLQ